jgi:WD40 repeat protein
MLKLIILIVSLSILAQTDTPVIDSENIDRLQSVRQIDFADLPNDAVVDSGWFTLSPDGLYFAVVRRDGGLVVYDSMEGEIADTFTVTGENGQPATVLDARFDNTGERIVTINTDGEAFYVVVHPIGDETIRYEFPAEYGMPVRVWFDDTDENVWLETMSADGSQYEIVNFPLIEDGEVMSLPSAPEEDEESFVRIGRIPAPFAITSTQEGIVKLWDLETGEITHEVDLEAVPVFGRVNETTGEQLAWRDPESQSLNVLDFETGENTLVAELSGDYIQALMLTPLADVVLAVHIGDEPVVAAWDVETGDEIALGEYRECGRVPDMVQLSVDGTTLVIGCDAGVEVWQIKE